MSASSSTASTAGLGDIFGRTATGRWRCAGWEDLPAARLYGTYRLVNLVQLIRSIASQGPESSRTCMPENRSCILKADGGQRASAPPPTRPDTREAREVAGLHNVSTKLERIVV